MTCLLASKEDVGIKQGFAHSPTLFGLCIDKPDEIWNKAAKEEGLEGPKIMHELIFILLYADDADLFSYNLDDVQHLMFWTLSVNSMG